ncbi:MAG: hypothetical protein Q9169_001459 [Polycauliona sp. 2 TL-2023]
METALPTKYTTSSLLPILEANEADNVKGYDLYVDMPYDHSIVEDSASGLEPEELLNHFDVEEHTTAKTTEDELQDVTTHSPPKVQESLDRILQFLSTASNETLGACIVGLGAATYFILGRVGLVLIGIVAGVAIHAIWEERNGQYDHGAESAEVNARKRREDGLSILNRVLDWRTDDHHSEPKVNGDVDAAGSKLSSPKSLNFSNFEPATGAALTGLTDAVIRDYVKYWLLISFVELD